jgi:hexosaminidase
MSHPGIPAPVRYDAGGREFAFRAGTRVAYADTRVAPIVERFCADVGRRTGVSAVPVFGIAGSHGPWVTIELSTEDELGHLPPARGLSPSGTDPPDERYSLVIDAEQVVVRAAHPVGVARGLTTLVQLLAATPSADDGEVRVPGGRILDAPRYSWRGLSLDVVRRFFTVQEVRRVVDLLALYKLNVLHLHLTDDQGWRLPIGRADGSSGSDEDFYSADDLHALVAYAADRFVTLIPEVDTPGHAVGLVQMHPKLRSGRNELEFEMPPGHKHQAAWLDPELPATFELMNEVLTGVAEIFASPFVHIGGDEPHGMPHELYESYVAEIRRLVRSLGKRPLGWNESARAGLDADDIIQYWHTKIPLAPGLPPEVVAQSEATIALCDKDIELAAAAAVPVIVSPLSHIYLDVPYADAPADPAQEERLGRVGLRALYAPSTLEQSFAWEPSEVLGSGRAVHVAGVEAVIWAETLADFADLSFLLLPRLAGVADKAWGDPREATWADHRSRLAHHGRLWEQDDLTYFRTSTVDWL